MSNIVYARAEAREDRQPVLLEAMRTIQFATVVTATASGGLKITHMPLIAIQDVGGDVILSGHFARANDHWKVVDESKSSTVAIFQGPHTYMSPSNYATKAETGKVVPTWTYITVHAHGTASTRNDADWLLAHVNSLTDLNEADRRKPWKVSDAPDDYISTMMRGVVGVELAVTNLEGVWKLNQHRSDEDKASMIAGLTTSEKMSDREICEAMQKTFSGSS